MTPKTLQLIELYGDKAYEKAVQFTVFATKIGDTVGAEMFSAVARELLEEGHHKEKPKEG